MGKQSNRDNRANQLNPNNNAYWQSRANEAGPADWGRQAEKDEKNKKE